MFHHSMESYFWNNKAEYFDNTFFYVSFLIFDMYFLQK